MKISLIFVLLQTCFFLTLNSFGQIKNHLIEYRFEGGSDGYFKYFSLNTIYPNFSRQDNSFGLSISSITIKPNGEIGDILIINPIDSEIDKMVTGLLKSSSKYWKKCDTTLSDLVMYVQIAFNLKGVKSNFGRSENFPENRQFIEPIFITVYLNTGGPKPLSDESLIKGCIENLNAENYLKALELINTLIKRYPYSIEFYQNRMKINEKLGRNDMVEVDKQKISHFGKGFSLDQIFIKNQVKLTLD